jgi:large subunit ribosomal protein L24
MQKIRKDDLVVVVAGSHRGRTGKVVRVLPEKSRVVVERINVVRRNVKPQGGRPGGVVEKEAPIHLSNVALWDAEAGRRVKVGFKVLEDGRKVRYDKATGKVVDR